jgi:hypothetical protein
LSRRKFKFKHPDPEGQDFLFCLLLLTSPIWLSRLEMNFRVPLGQQSMSQRLGKRIKGLVLAAITLASALLVHLTLLPTDFSIARETNHPNFPSFPRIEAELAATEAAKADLKAKQGKFLVFHDEIENQNYQELSQIFQKEKVFETFAEALNKTLILPTDIAVVLGECGVENAFYNPEKKVLGVCYELIGHFAKIFAPSASSNQELGEAILYTTLFVFFHETGHALVDVLNLPVTGREEDAVDEFSTILLMEAGEEGEKAVLNAAQWFLLEGSKNSEIQKLAFWDEHSLDLQRFFGIACLVYGKNPDKYAGLVQQNILPEARAQRCPREYAKKSKSWETLLAPYARG